MDLRGNQQKENLRKVGGSLYPKSSSPDLEIFKATCLLETPFLNISFWPRAGTPSPANSFTLETQLVQLQKGVEAGPKPFIFPKDSLPLTMNRVQTMALGEEIRAMVLFGSIR